MSLDLAELVYKLEKLHGVAVDWDALDKINRKRDPPDVTVAEFHAYLNDEAHRTCRDCHYLLRGLPAIGVCPECGTSYSSREVDLETTINTIAEFVALDRIAVRPESFMAADLAMG